MRMEKLNSNSDNSTKFKYWVFISYSHQDIKWARWLRNRIERYRIPRRLIGRKTSTGKVPHRIYPVFIDRDELPSSSNLPLTLKNVLKESLFLVVICSPRSADSRWVNEEIKFFKILGRQTQILCLILDGEPYATDYPEVSLLEALPEAIRFNVNQNGEVVHTKEQAILAADLRKVGDGKRNAKLKVLSGIIGVSYNELKQRNKKRLINRLILSAIPVLMLIAFLIWWQSNSRQIYQIKRDLVGLSSNLSETHALEEVAIAFTCVGELEHARQIANAITHDYTKASTLNEIATSAAKIGEIDKAIILLKQSIMITNIITDDKNKFTAQLATVKCAAKLAEVTRDSLFFKQALQVTKEIRDEEYKAYALCAMAESAAKIGEVDKAITFFEQSIKIANIITDDSYKFKNAQLATVSPTFAIRGVLAS